ncbi:MAG: hypothetical protein COA54_03710 [Thiotrichaceae bacterium]|nr:MAG: hypothetical protein COA54_03710 [Thiotrichaceae bacterium]
MNDTDLEQLKNNENTDVSYKDETIVWEGRPSQWVNMGTYLWWTIFLVGSIVAMSFWSSGFGEDYPTGINSAVTWVGNGLISLSIISMLLAYLTVHYEHTVITRNKIKESKGITSIFRQDLYCEISDIKDIKSPPAGVMGVLGLSTLVIETNDDDQALIKIRGIKHREELIQLILPIWRKLKVDRKGYFGDR